MAVKQKYKPKIEWDQTAFKEMQASWSSVRKARDKKELKTMFKAAKASPLLMEELAWAKAHGIKFFIDRQAVNVGGYYVPGTGVVAVGAKDVSKYYGLEVLGHELRHAWQDYNEILTRKAETLTANDFAASFIKLALIEADAYAYGKRVFDEVLFGGRSRRVEESENADLAKKFLSWFKRDFFSFSSNTEFYGDNLSKHSGLRQGVYQGSLPLRNYEFQPKGLEEKLKDTGLSIDNLQDVLRLGWNFSGTKNYLAEMPPEFLAKKILSPALANIFWGSANNNQKKLTTDLRKAFLKATHAPVRVNGKLRATRGPARHRWP